MKDESKLSVAECAYCVIFSIGIIYFDKSEHRPIDIVPIIFGFIISFYYAFFKITISLHLERNDKISDVMAKFQKELDNKLCAIFNKALDLENEIASKIEGNINIANDNLKTAKKEYIVVLKNRYIEIASVKKDYEIYFREYPPICVVFSALFMFMCSGFAGYYLGLKYSSPGDQALGTFYIVFLFGILGPHLATFIKYMFSKSKVTK